VRREIHDDPAKQAANPQDSCDMAGAALPIADPDTAKAARMNLPLISKDMSDEDITRMMKNACDASNFLKAISHEGRLMILCHLASGEKSVTELEELLSSRQAAVSQQLSRLRQEGLVRPRREGKVIYYALSDPRAVRVLDVVYDIFCNPG
jgi:ArsR family transcriptional regulator